MLAALAASLVLPAAVTGPLSAGEADVLAAEIERQADGRYSIAVTVRHDDEGWDHYADAWEVLAPDGALLATRALAHPHVGEQPFTRRLAAVAIPDGLAEVTLRAHDSRHCYGGTTLTLAVPR